MRAVSTSREIEAEKKYVKYYAVLELPPESSQVDLVKL